MQAPQKRKGRRLLADRPIDWVKARQTTLNARASLVTQYETAEEPRKSLTLRAIAVCDKTLATVAEKISHPTI